MKNFEEYLKEGIVDKRFPDRKRMKSLTEEAEKRKVFLEEQEILRKFLEHINYFIVYIQLKNKIKLRDDNANYFIENSYDIIMEMIRAIMLKERYISSGKGSHEAEVSFLRELGLPEKEVRFVDELRYFRNGILYYGKSFDRDYGNKTLEFLEKIYPKLKEKITHL